MAGTALPRRLALSLACAAAAVMALACAPPEGAARPARREAPLAAGGVLDLSGWDFLRDGPLRLEGQWLFYPGSLLGAGDAGGPAAPATARRVPDFWNGGDAGGSSGRGAGTYRLRVLLGEGCPELGIRVPTVSTAFELEANGVAVARAGRPALLARDAEPGCFTGVRGVPSGARELDLVVRVSNHEYRHGGMWRAFSLGPLEELRDAKAAEDGLILAFCGGAAAAAAVFLLLFRYRRREIGNLYFASFAATMALRSLVTGDYLLASAFPSLPFGLLVRLTYFTAFAPVPLCVLFFGSLFPREIPLRARKLACAPFLLLGAALAAPLGLLTRVIYVLYPLIIVVAALLLVLGLGRAALRRRPGSGPMLATSALLVAAGISDMLSSSLILSRSNLLFPALAVLIFAQASILARRFAAAFDSAERLSAELARANDGLDRQVRARTKELEDAYLHIKELSVKDPLTGAFNRRYLDQELAREMERALRYGMPLSLLFCDFDHFKAINDRYGHGAGDQVLRAFSRIVSLAIRGNVDWLARYGGEEFLVVAPGTRPADAAKLAERLRAQAESEAVESEAGPVSYTLSFGVAGLEAGDASARACAEARAAAESLVARADAALYAAKRGGRNRVELAR